MFMNTDKLIFVYNADSGRLNALGHSLHKLISPSTYECNLCQLTHGFFKEKQSWSEFLKELAVAVEFLHRDEFQQNYPECSFNEYPLILAVYDSKISLFMDKSSFEKIATLEDLVTEIKCRLSK